MEKAGGIRMVNSNLAYKTEQISQPKIIVNEKPLKWCSVSLSDVVSRGKRLEASVFDVEAKQTWDIVLGNKFGSVPLYGKDGLIELAYYPGWMQRSRLKRIWCDRLYGEGFYLPSQMMDVYPFPEKFISRLADCDMNELRLKKNTLLLTRSGTVGNVSYVSKTLDGRIFSDDVIRITFKEKYDLGYVYTFLKSKVGNIILKTNGYGSVITHIEPGHLEEIRVPNAPVVLREKINNLISRSFELRDESNGLIDQATALLVGELHLPEISAFNPDYYKKNAPIDTFSVKLSEIAGRLDASYHVPIADSIIEHIQKYADHVTTIDDMRVSKEVILPGRFKRVYVDEGHGRVFIGGKQLYELDPTNKKYLSNVHHGNRIAKQLELHENMTLITCSGTIGKVMLVGKHWENWTANQHIIRIVPASVEMAGYISIFLSSDYGYQLITRFTYGSVVDEIDDNHVRQIAIPLLKDKAVQKKINDLALEANAKRYEAYTLEQEALRIMNDEVISAK
jgi:type I restriction enzyme S subunit